MHTLPQEIIEHVAFFAATEPFIGPPSAIIPLLSTCRPIYDYLSITSNHHLYARIFAHKFDLAPAIRRLGPRVSNSAILSSELRRRCIYLRRIKHRLDAVADCRCAGDGEGESEDTLRATLWTAYLMMLENDGKNEIQLREYAGIDGWLRQYWFDEDGASTAKCAISRGQWPLPTEHASLAMWLFWFLLRPGEYSKNDFTFWDITAVLKVLALAAHKYSLALPTWIDFVPVTSPASQTVTHYSESRRLDCPPLATPAILSFLTLTNRSAPSSLGFDTIGLTNSNIPLTALPTQDSSEWDCDWERCLNLGQANFGNTLTSSFKPGSIEGLWEGIFTYTEFSAYAALLCGAPPLTLQNCLAVQHRQTWKLREHHLLAPTTDSGSSANPLSAGSALRSYFPVCTVFREDPTGLDVQQRNGTIRYQRADLRSKSGGEMPACQPAVQDIIITGEGHSAWGQFNLTGRVRPYDGFVSLSKEYSDGDRGRWLYRGYLVGNVNGRLCGRWRDTVSPPDVPGYEGCFMMSRRR